MAYGNIFADTLTNSNGQVGNAIGPGFKNRIINGAMRIDQRNAGASITLSGSAQYPVDRWACVEDTDGAMTAQQDSSAPTGFVNSVKFTTTTADGTLGSGQSVQVTHRIEGTNVSDLAWGTANAKTVTLSFWVRSSLTGTFGGTVQNSANNRSYPFTYTISAADTWEQKTVTIAGDTTGTWLTTTGIGLTVRFGLGVASDLSGTAGSWAGADYRSATGATSVIGTLNATWYVTGVQLEVGESATSFDYRPYGTELALCQRYYEIARGGQSIAGTTSAISTNVSCSVEKRGTPTVALSSNLYRDNTGTTTPNHASITVRGSRFVWTPSSTSAAEYHAEFTYSAEL